MTEEIGFETCSECDGRGYTNTDNGNRYILVRIGGFDFYRMECKKCDGRGKITWLENVFVEQKETSVSETWKYNDWFRTKKEPREKNWKHWGDKR